MAGKLAVGMRGILTILVLFVALQGVGQTDTLLLNVKGHNIKVCSNSIVEIPEQYENGNYQTDSMTILNADNKPLLTIAPRPKCSFIWYERNDSTFFYSTIWLPVKSDKDWYPSHDAYGRGIPATHIYTLELKDDRIEISNKPCFKGYKLAKDSIKKVKEMYDAEKRKVVLLHERPQDLKKEYPDDSSWSPDIFYWCKLIAEWNGDKAFVSLIEKDFATYGDDFRTSNDHQLLLDNIQLILKYK